MWWEITDFPLIILLLQILGGIFQAIMWMGVITMEKSWRIGIDNENPGKLVTKGIFGVSRNPIFFGLDGILLVSLCLYPNLFNLIFTLCSIIGIHIQILREEKQLSKIYGEEYKKYKKNVKRYFLIV
jgi:protein-S-isoprenylcysteine O-methyltransferase Ste14